VVYLALGQIGNWLGLFIPDQSLDLLVALQAPHVLFGDGGHLLLHDGDLALLLDRLLLGLCQGNLLRCRVF
jgi:hypothetical protein